MNVVPLNAKTIGWGATPADWQHFSQVLGLVADLQPVVSNPNATISQRSKLKDLGKVPSKYNEHGEVVGIGNWTNLNANATKVSSWSNQADYGICLQTRYWRGFDIDVPDQDKADAIAEFIQDSLLQDLPKRKRPNSGKMLLAVRVPGELGKRDVTVDGGKVEFLATGQQFIAVGTHPSGARYEWEGGLPDGTLEISEAEVDALWSALVRKFGTGASNVERVTMRRQEDDVDMPDPVAAHLEAHGLTLGETRGGAVIVKCPWEDGHTSGSTGDTSTVWFKAGTRGYALGHFDCRHASCAGRTDESFHAAIGYVEAPLAPPEDFQPVPDSEVTPIGGPIGGASGNSAPALRRVRGMAEATIDNVVKALRVPEYVGMQIRFDGFRDEIMYAAPGCNQWMSFTDSDYSRLRIKLGDEKRFKPVGRELMRDAVLLVASENPFDSAVEWLNQQVWDGVPRVETFLTRYMGVEDSAYTRAVSRYLWTAMAGRVMEPGVKADMVPILVGEQGARKSTAVKYMVPDDAFFTELSLDEKDDDLSRKMRGRLIAELGELRGLHTKELESIKAFITRTHENWIPKYREFATKFPRRLVFIGTTNQEEFLADETGNRRWLPVKVGDLIDTDAIKADCMQLWAESAEIHLLNGIEYSQAEKLAVKVHAQHTMTDPWADAVGDWLERVDLMSGQKPADWEFLRVSDVLKSALGFDTKHVKKYEEMRMGRVLRALGYGRVQRTINGARIRVFVPTSLHLKN